MSLWFILRAGAHEVGWMEVQRVTNTDRNPLEPGDVSEYEIQVTQGFGHNPDMTGTVQHRYGDGPWVLLRKALDAAIPAARGYYPCEATACGRMTPRGGQRYCCQPCRTHDRNPGNQPDRHSQACDNLDQHPS